MLIILVIVCSVDIDSYSCILICDPKLSIMHFPNNPQYS